MHPCPLLRANAGITEQQVKLRPGAGRDSKYRYFSRFPQIFLKKKDTGSFEVE